MAARKPDAVALSFAGDTLSYGELAERVNRIARLLVEHGVEPERLVAVAIPRSVDYVAVTLGVLAAGGVCLPLDPGWASPTRLSRLITDAGATILVTTSALAERLPHSHLRTLVLDAPGTVAALAGRSGLPLTAVDGGAGPTPDAAAYVLLTRGSTTPPKPVSVSHRAVLSALARPAHAVTTEDVWAMVPAFAAGVTVLTPWSAFLHGGRLEVVDDTTASSPAALADLLHRRGVTMRSQSPSVYEFLSRAGESAPGAEDRRSVLLTGDPVDAAVVAAPGSRRRVRVRRDRMVRRCRGSCTGIRCRPDGVPARAGTQIRGSRRPPSACRPASSASCTSVAPHWLVATTAGPPRRAPTSWRVPSARPADACSAPATPLASRRPEI